MSAKITKVLFVHGANQANKDKEKNLRTWQEAFDVSKYANKVQQLVEGNYNTDVQAYHKKNHQGRDYPEYSGWMALWYGDVWKNIVAAQTEPFAKRLDENEKSYKAIKNDRNSILEKLEHWVMEKHFDELVPFYELAVINDDGRTFYEAICQQFLNQLIESTNSQHNYVLVAHSMGCAVTYNVMSHISCAQANTGYCLIDGTLSQSYRQAIAEFANSSAKCFGLLTFGNYMGYNWCQRLNNRILFGEYKKQYVYPKAIGRWYNFWTMLGGDPYIIDDRLGNDIVGDKNGRYDDVSVPRMPGTKIGHGRAMWFRRNTFAKKLRDKMFQDLYL